MKNVIRMMVLLLGMIFGKESYAQMVTAQKSVWDIEISTHVNTSVSTLWVYMNNTKKLALLSNGYVTSIHREGTITPIFVTVLLSNGKKRMESIVQNDARYKFLIINVKKESLPKGVKDCQIAIFTKEEAMNTSSISWKAKVEGNKKGKKLLLSQLKAEFEAYKIGFSKV